MRDLTVERHLNPRPEPPGRGVEHIANSGHLKVPVMRWLDSPPAREGWEPFFVNVNLADPVVKVYTYRRSRSAR